MELNDLRVANTLRYALAWCLVSACVRSVRLSAKWMSVHRKIAFAAINLAVNERQIDDNYVMGCLFGL